MPRTTRLDRRWPEYYSRSFKPETDTDRWRVALLNGRAVETEENHPSRNAHLSAEISKLERLGYDVARTDGGSGRLTYKVRNPEHRPTEEQFAAVRHVYAPKPGANGNGNAPDVAVLAGMLPALGERVTVVMVGFGDDGEPSLVLTTDAGWRYACAVTRADAPREP